MLAMRLCHLVSLFLLEIGSVLSNPATHVYTPECAPPDGAVATTTPTPLPDNATIFYHGVLPIEYCCPQLGNCKKWGGFCALKWLLETVLPECDYYENEVCRDYGCACCIKCSRDKCSKCVQHGGNCRHHCKSDEIRDHFKKCDYQYCQCCKKCEMLDECAAANGTCRANHYDCPPGTAASTGCCGGCACCKPELQKDFQCERKTGSYCALREEDCVQGYYACFGECVGTQFYNGLTSPLVGYCCSPKNGLSSRRGRMDELDYDTDEEAIEDIESENLNNLAPRPLGGNREQGNVEEVVEDEIYKEVVHVKKHEEVDVDTKLSNVEEVVEEVVAEPLNDEAHLKEGNNLHVEFASPIQEDSDTNAVIDTPMDISDQVFDKPIDISDQVLDSPMFDETIESVNQVDEIDGEVEKPKHHRRHKKQ